MIVEIAVGIYVLGIIGTMIYGAIDVQKLGGIKKVAAYEGSSPNLVRFDVILMSFVWPYSWYEAYRMK